MDDGFGSGGGIVFIEDLSFFKIVVVFDNAIRVCCDLIVGDDGFGGVFYNHFCSLSFSFSNEL